MSWRAKASLVPIVVLLLTVLVPSADAWAACGDGIIESIPTVGQPSEECDDGGTLNADGCNQWCKVESGYTCTGEPSVCTAGVPATCGDGALDPGEECDDGNAVPGDGCTDCVDERCGDGVVNDSIETCDDGARKSFDGCDIDCQVEPGWDCIGDPSVCTSLCGNGAVDAPEECDDGNTVAGDGCDAECLSELCGDGIVQTALGETCDDFNLVGGDGCDGGCIVETGWDCTDGIDSGRPTPSICLPICGDGLTLGYEECDDGNTVPGDGCNEVCFVDGCGDGYADSLLSETCDDGNLVAGDGCDASCQTEPGYACDIDGWGGCVAALACDPSPFDVISESTISNDEDDCPFDRDHDGDGDGMPDCVGQTIYVYRNVPAFTLDVGEYIAFDSEDTSSTPVTLTIELAAALTNGDSNGQPSGAFTTVVTSATSAIQGNDKVGDFDLRFAADVSYTHAGGGLLIRITHHSGETDVIESDIGEPGSLAVSTWADEDGTYPWDILADDNDAADFAIFTGPLVCREAIDHGQYDDGGICDPATSRCSPLHRGCGGRSDQCGKGTATSCSSCFDNAYYNWYSSGSCSGGVYCLYDYLERLDYGCYSSTSIESSGNHYCTTSSSAGGTYTTVTSVLVYCQTCDDEDPCTTDACSSTCSNTEIAPTACYGGDPTTRGIGTCQDGLEYCRNPGECINEVQPVAETCDTTDEDCDGVINDSPDVDASCDDGDPGTFDECVAGACTSGEICGGTDTSCGPTGACESCDALDGWYDTGPAEPCCTSGETCTCTPQEQRDYYCSGTTCPFAVIGSGVVITGCATCDDGNVCTEDSCDPGSGLCSNTAFSYSTVCYEGPAGTEGVGICEAGFATCSGTTLGSCSDVPPTTETCDNRDEDCNGIVDDGAADSCAMTTQLCWSGQCDDSCTSNAECAAAEFCYFENGETVGRCAPQTDPCDDVTCPAGTTCHVGSCTSTSCINDADCNQYSACYTSGRCLNDPDDRCDGVQCANGDQCVNGDCQTPCFANADCGAGERCYDNFCFPDVDPCEGVDCRVSETCWQGSCYEQCGVDSDCTVSPDDVCWDAFRCAPEVDPCDRVVCAQGDLCYQGSCYPDCSVVNCVDANDQCYDASRCATDNCEGVQCPDGEACQGGVCYLTCADDAECNPPDVCWGSFCKPGPCDGVQCAVGEVCSGGACYVSCTADADCSALDPSHLCYGGLCTDDPCAGVLCPTPGDVCLGGGCYPYCTDNAQCIDPGDVCYDVNVCATDPTDLCADVNCPSDQFCYSASCYYDCSSNADCTVYDASHACYNGRCAADACEGVSCPIGDVCSQGTCYQYCDGTTVCSDPSHICYNNTCRPEPLDLCADVVCAVGEVCSDGTCYQYCDGSADCTDPSHVCYDNLCQDPCDSTTCLAGETCHLGTCYEYCDGTDPCSNPNHICYDNRCVDAEDPWCDGVMCPSGEDCYRGTCYVVCGSDADCSALPYDSICYQNVCLPTDCTPDPCETGEVCYNGACYEDCSGGTQCSDPNMACYDNRCAASACEAQAVNFLTDYDDNHLFHKLSKRLYAWQYSTPWMWPRPYEDPGTGFVSWADVGSGEGSSSDNDALYEKGAARVVMYYDSTDNTYVLYLIQGSKDAAQGATEATYGVRVKSTSPQILVMDDPGAEGARITNNGGGTWTYIQLDITTGASETGGVAIGRFNANAAAWRIEINGHFSGDIDRWELMNGETGTPIRKLNMGEPLTIENKEFSVADEVQPDFGVTSCDTGNLGVCGPGSVTACVNWGLECTQTVYPWGFEICDGLDNTCNGQVDTLDPTLKFAVAETRQASIQPWSAWPTVDSNSDINAYMNFTSRTNDTVGSTNILRPDGSPLQRADKVIMAMHRHLPTGHFSMPMVVGAKSEDEDDREDFGDSDFRMDVYATSGDKIEELWVCWYDDREPGYTEDQIPQTYDVAADMMDFDWEVEDIAGHLESDSAVLRPVWLEGKTGRTISYAVDFKISDEDDLERRWRRYSPGIGEQGLWRTLDFYVRIVATNPDEAYCISDTLTANGCPVGYYQCTATGIQCGPADDAACASSCADWDGDGHIRYDPGFCPDGTDCDDFDPETHRGATEFCNGRDNDCDGNIDYQSEASAEQPLCTADDPCGPFDCNGNFVCSCPNDVREEVGDPVDVCTCGEALGR